jgi:site-specific recombinase XerD
MKATFIGLKYGIKFLLESRVDKKTGEKILENVPIIMSVSFNGQRLFQNIGFRTNANHWEIPENNFSFPFQTKNTFNKDGVSAAIINAAIRNHAAAVDKVFSRLEEYPPINKFRDLLKEELKHPEKRQKNKASLLSYFDQFIEERSINVSSWRIKQFITCKNHLIKYADEKGLTLTFNNFSLAVLNDFDKYLRTDKEKPKGPNSISGLHTRLQTFFNYAVQQGWTKNNPYNDFKIENEVYGDPIYLTKEELDTLYNKEITNEKLARVRDMFCLQCFVGARVGDFTKLKHENIIDNTLQFVASKTVKERATLCKVPLTSRAWSIINKYDLPSGDLVPYITGQKYNVYLKELFQFCELNRKVARLNPLTRTTEIIELHKIAHNHMARSTFIGILFKHTKNEVISSMSGHSQGSKAFRRYYGITQDDRIDAIKNLE